MVLFVIDGELLQVSAAVCEASAVGLWSSLSLEWVLAKGQFERLFKTLFLWASGILEGLNQETGS